MTTIIAEDTSGCEGVRLPIQGRAAAICIGCSRFGEPSPHIEPMAKKLAGGEWFCPNRKSEAEGGNE